MTLLTAIYRAKGIMGWCKNKNTVSTVTVTKTVKCCTNLVCISTNLKRQILLLKML